MNSKVVKSIKLIDKLKSVVSKRGREVKPTASFPHVLSSVAEKIQMSHQKYLLKEKNCTKNSPPYLKIARQLQVDNEQIRQAVVYNLINISKNKFSDEISGILTKYVKEGDSDLESVKMASVHLMKVK